MQPTCSSSSIKALRAFAAMLLLCTVFPLQSGAQEALNQIPGIQPLVEKAIEAGDLPGAVILIGTPDRVLHFQAIGQRQILPDAEPMTFDTVFDLASLTKPIATGTSILLLAERGLLEINAPVSRYLPEFGKNGKADVTVDQLLIHTSGLIADNNLRDYSGGKEKAWEQICNLPLMSPPGTRFVYSDVGYITLGFLIEKISGQTLQEFTQQSIFVPLKMSETGYLPAERLQKRSAPAGQQQNVWLKGKVHDPRCAALGGVAGHAGLFSTASDLSRFARMILNHGELEGVRVLKPETVEAMLVSRKVSETGVRTWGWDRKTGFSSNRGAGMSDQAIGHGGFTGTGMWIDPGKNLYVIFLSNRLHPDGKGAVNQLIGQIGGLAVEFLENVPAR